MCNGVRFRIGNWQKFRSELPDGRCPGFDNEEVSRIWLLMAGAFLFCGARAESAQELGDNRVPDEVRFKSGYVNPVPKPPGFSSAMLWGIAIADTRVHGWKNAKVEIATTELSCRIDGNDVLLNSDRGDVRGGLFILRPWFGEHNRSEPMAIEHDLRDRGAILRVGQQPDRIWHFWAASPRARIPEGKLEGCTVKMKVKISTGALVQIGMDYWRDTRLPFGAGGNNHEAGASNWYFPSNQWQEAKFTDIDDNP